MAAHSPLLLLLLLLLGLTSIQRAAAQQITIQSPAAGAVLHPGQRADIVLKLTSTTSSVQTVALTLGLRAQASGAALVLKTLYASDLHIDPRDYSYRFSLRLPPAKHLVAGAAPYELVLSQYLLLGATQSPMLYSNSTLVTLQK